MSQRVQKVKQHRDTRDVEDEGYTRTRETASQTARELDELLDEVDSVLEENAEEFVAGYVQKGGE